MSIGYNGGFYNNQNNIPPEVMAVYGIAKPQGPQQNVVPQANVAPQANFVAPQAQMVYGILQPTQDMFVPQASQQPQMYAVYGIQTPQAGPDTFVRSNQPRTEYIYGIQMPGGQPPQQ